MTVGHDVVVSITAVQHARSSTLLGFRARESSMEVDGSRWKYVEALMEVNGSRRYQAYAAIYTRHLKMFIGTCFWSFSVREDIGRLSVHWKNVSIAIRIR